MSERTLITRKSIIYIILIAVGLVFTGRLFQIQVVNGEHYKTLAQAEQLRKFTIPAERGSIYLRDGEEKIPIVLNQDYKTVYVDPRYVEDPARTATKLADVLGGSSGDYLSLMNQEDKVYVVLKKNVEPKLAEKVEELELAGVGLQSSPKRVYPEGSLASQLLGFVNDDRLGQYGLEGYLNDQLSGESGLLHTVTDARGIPLSTSDAGNIDIPAKDGDDIVLTIDRSVQSSVETAVKHAIERTKGDSASAIVMDPKSGAVLAMANYPTYDPAKFYKEEDASVYQNLVVSDPYEPGSVMKPFTMSAGLQTGAVTPTSTYYDTGSVEIDGWTINNALEKSWGERSMREVIVLSLNTGAIHVLKQLGGGEINLKARETLYDYLTKNYRFGTTLNVSQTNEQPGLVISPTDGEGNNVKYSNMTFGQGLTATMLQVASSFSALVNGGDFYQPYLVHSVIDGVSGEETVNGPKIISNNAIHDDVSKELRKMLIGVVEDGGGYYAERPGYTIGGKTGTTQLTDPDGSYSTSRYIGSFIGFISGGTVNEVPDLVVMVRVVEPKVGVGAGSEAAAPVFGEIADFLINYYQIPPSSK